MRVLFLDMDGVLNSQKFFDSLKQEPKDRMPPPGLHMGTFTWMIDSVAVSLLNTILERTGNPRVVISSSWRWYWTDEQIATMLQAKGFAGDIIGHTPFEVVLPEGIEEHARGHEIQAWLDEHKDVERFVILDDTDDMAHLVDQLVQSTWELGLQSEHVEPAVAMLLAKTTTVNGREKAT